MIRGAPLGHKGLVTHLFLLDNFFSGKEAGMEKYIASAKKLDMINALIISPQDVFFDSRAILKCRWGCEDYDKRGIRCDTRGTTFEERVGMIKSYNRILLVHSHDAHKLSRTVLEIERAAFLDGHYFAFAVRFCNLCKVCKVRQGKPCPTPDQVRPCDQSFGIDVYKTVRKLGLPCQVLQEKSDLQNRYGFVLMD
jgi:predicted metal-binding protein